MKKLKVFLVEDDALSSRLIQRHLEQHDELEWSGQAATLKEAVDFLDQQQPDLVFLDIELPDGRGFELIPHLTAQTRIVVLTGDESYAFTAFENGAIDFLKKPVTPARFKACIDKIRAVAPAGTAKESTHLFVKSGYKHIRVELAELLFAEAVGDYVKLHLRNKKPLLINISMKELIARLSGFNFVQVHRSYVVNPDHIDSVDEEGISFGEHLVPVGKTFKPSLQRLLR